MRTPNREHAITDVDASKALLRDTCKREREALSASARDAAAARLAAHGIDFAGPVTGAAISAYLAIGAELDPAPLLARLVAAGARTCLPVLTAKGNPLVFRAWSPGEPLVGRMWGIREPEPTAEIVEPDILLVPLLAFDAAGWRLGYGGGYYDRTLARLRALKPVVAIGLAFDEQQVDHVPRGPFDQPLDWVLTASGAFRPLLRP